MKNNDFRIRFEVYDKGIFVCRTTGIEFLKTTTSHTECGYDYRVCPFFMSTASKGQGWYLQPLKVHIASNCPGPWNRRLQTLKKKKRNKTRVTGTGIYHHNRMHCYLLAFRHESDVHLSRYRHEEKHMENERCLDGPEIHMMIATEKGLRVKAAARTDVEFGQDDLGREVDPKTMHANKAECVCGNP